MQVLPAFQDDGFLPPGLHLAALEEIEARFAGTPLRRELFERLQGFVELARHAGARRMFVDGSFVTAKLEPGDMDVVIWLNGGTFSRLIRSEDPQANELELMFLTREPKEAFVVFGEARWLMWSEFFSSVKQRSDIQKGLVEVQLR